MKQNVLIFCVDEMRADHMGCAGNKIVKTPHIDKLSQRGTYFPNAYCNNPICMPARASMFTGLLPRDHGLRINGQSLSETLPTMPQIFADNAYRTHSAGKLHLTPWVTNPDEKPRTDLFPESMDYWNNEDICKFPTPYYGFQTVDMVGGHTSFTFGPYIKWLQEQGVDPALLSPSKALKEFPAPCTYKMALPEEFHYNRYIADSTIKEIEKKSDSPFFIWCSFPDPHLPCAPPKPYCDMYNPEDMPFSPSRPDEYEDLPPFYQDVIDGKIKPNGVDNTNLKPEFFQQITAMTYGMITHLDSEIGRIMSALEKSGKLDNTIVVFIADHGDMMGDHGLLWKSYFTFRSCTNIPFIISAPGLPKNMTNHNLVSQIDLMPTILDLCGLNLPGSNWTELKTKYERGSLMKLNNYPGKSVSPMLSQTDAEIRDSVVIENDDPTTGLHVRCLITRNYRLAIYPGTEHGELFDLKNDPDELYNLWYKEEHNMIKNRLVLKLLTDYSSDTPYYPIPIGNA